MLLEVKSQSKNAVEQPVQSRVINTLILAEVTKEIGGVIRVKKKRL